MPSLVLCLYIGRAIRTIQSLSFILFSYLVYPSLIRILYIHFYTVQSIVLFSKPNDDLSILGRNHHWSSIGDPLISEISMTISSGPLEFSSETTDFYWRPQAFHLGWVSNENLGFNTKVWGLQLKSGGLQ